MWQLSELNRLLEENEQQVFSNSKTLYLTNPEENTAIDQRIIEEIWPGAVAALRENQITTWHSPDKSLMESIISARGQFTTKELVFLLDDPDRPMGPGSTKPWYCRIKIRCSSLNYMISSDFIVSVPTTFSTAKLFKLVKEPLMQGNPPSLSYSDGHSNEETFDITFTGGHGAGWGLHSSEQAKDNLFTITERNLAIINAMCDLETDYSNTRYFNVLHNAVLNAYEAQ